MSDSNKITDARKHNIPIISERDLREILSPVEGSTGEYLAKTGHTFSCIIVCRSSDYCTNCNDTMLIVSLTFKEKPILLRTCWCNFKLYTPNYE